MVGGLKGGRRVAVSLCSGVTGRLTTSDGPVEPRVCINGPILLYRCTRSVRGSLNGFRRCVSSFRGCSGVYNNFV